MAGVGLALVSLIFGGWTRPVSPLTWAVRPRLQFESDPGDPADDRRPGARRAAGCPARPNSRRTRSLGLGVPAPPDAEHCCHRAGVRGDRWAVGPRIPGEDAGPGRGRVVVLSIVAIMIVTNKTRGSLPPWLGGPMPAPSWLKRDEVTEPECLLIRRLAVQLLVLALLTQLVFPPPARRSGRPPEVPCSFPPPPPPPAPPPCSPSPSSWCRGVEVPRTRRFLRLPAPPPALVAGGKLLTYSFPGRRSLAVGAGRWVFQPQLQGSVGQGTNK